MPGRNSLWYNTEGQEKFRSRPCILREETKGNLKQGYEGARCAFVYARRLHPTATLAG
jgi:hypothetical protein